MMEIPTIIKDVGFDFEWSEPKVWALNEPVTEIPIKELVWHFEIPFWQEGNGVYNLKPIDVLRDPEAHRIEYDRAMAAD